MLSPARSFSSKIPRTAETGARDACQLAAPSPEHITGQPFRDARTCLRTLICTRSAKGLPIRRPDPYPPCPMPSARCAADGSEPEAPLVISRSSYFDLGMTKGRCRPAGHQHSDP